MQYKQRASVPYGSRFVYEQLHSGNSHELDFDRLGRVEPHVEIPRAYLETQQSWIGAMGQGCTATVHPYPGKEKHLGRWFRYYEGHLIKILEIPKQYDYFGMFLPQFLQTRPMLNEAQIQEHLAAGMPVFHRGYCGSWSRLLYWKRNQGLDVVELDLTPLNPWEWPEIGTIHFRVHCTEPYPDCAYYAEIPDVIRDEIDEMVFEDVAAELLTKDFMAEFTVEKLKAYSGSTCGTQMTLEKIREAIAD